MSHAYPEVIEFEHPHVYCQMDEDSSDEVESESCENTECYTSDESNECENNECYSDYVHLANYYLADKLSDPDAIVAPSKITIRVDYPLNGTYEFHIDGKNDFTRRELAEYICSLYQDIYQEEEATIKNKQVLPIDQRGVFINRNRTDGKYGIWATILAI